MRSLAAGDADQLVAVDERMAGIAPQRRLRVVFLGQILLPDDVARIGLEADEIAFAAERVDLVAIDDRRAPRPGRVGNRVLHRVLVMPHLLPVASSRHSTRSMPVNSLRSKLSTFTFVVGHVVGDEHLVRQRRPGPAYPPATGTRHTTCGPPSGNFSTQPVLAPHVVALRPHPLRPIVGACDVAKVTKQLPAIRMSTIA